MPRKKRDPATIHPKPGYGFSDVLALTNATRSNLIHWTNIHLIQPAIEDTAGPGYPRRFSPLNVIQTELCVFVNRFGVPTEVMHGALAEFNVFHTRAVALYEEMEPRMPLVHDLAHQGLFRNEEERRHYAESFIRANLPYPPVGDGDLREANDYAMEMARVWGYLRTGPLVRGIPDPENRRFLGLFVGVDHDYAMVGLDPKPKELALLVGDAAMVIDLATVVFRVGERCQASGHTLGAW